MSHHKIILIVVDSVYIGYSNVMYCVEDDDMQRLSFFKIILKIAEQISNIGLLSFDSECHAELEL